MKGTSIGSVAFYLGPVAGRAAAQSWPNRPGQVVVPSTAGSATDVMHLGESTQKMPDTHNRQLMQQIVDNAAPARAAGVTIGGAQ